MRVEGTQTQHKAQCSVSVLYAVLPVVDGEWGCGRGLCCVLWRQRRLHGSLFQFVAKAQLNESYPRRLPLCL